MRVGTSPEGVGVGSAGGVHPGAGSVCITDIIYD